MRRVVFGLFAFAFAGFAALQVNDPDPGRWMVIYLAAMVACVFVDDTTRARQIPGGIAAIAFLWALTLAPGVLAEAELADLVRTMKTENHAEEAREVSGLAIVVAVMIAAALHPAPVSGAGDAPDPGPPGPPSRP